MSAHKPAMTVTRKCRITTGAMQKVLGKFLAAHAEANDDGSVTVPEDVTHKLETIQQALAALDEAPKKKRKQAA